MIKYFLVLFSLLSPLSGINPGIVYNPSGRGASIVCMVPPPDGGYASRYATNKVNPPGCSINSSSTTQPDGSVEKRETLTCTKVTVTSPSGSSSTKKPKSGSKQSKADKKMMEEFASD